MNKRTKKLVSDTIQIKSPKKGLMKARKLILYFCRANGLSDVDIDVFEMAVTEACHNAVRHGGKNEEGVYCELELIINKNDIKAVIRDFGQAFELNDFDPFNVQQDFMKYKDGGLGIPLIKTLMDDVSYKKKAGNGNELVLIKHLK